MSILITPDELATDLASAHPPVVLDVRWRLDRPDGRSDYSAGHLPGAVYVDLNTELAEHGAPGDGRHPLPPIDRLQEAARRWGIHHEDAVVVYDDLNNLSSSRAWWLLTAAGIAGVRILDGSLQAWAASGRGLESGDVTPEPGDVALAYGHLPTVELEAAASFPSHGVLLDARAGDRYRGETEPVDPRAGHIPGAISAPTAENIDDHGHFLAPDALRARFGALGIGQGCDLAVYCGSGVTASHQIAALTIAGFPAALPRLLESMVESPRPAGSRRRRPGVRGVTATDFGGRTAASAIKRDGCALIGGWVTWVDGAGPVVGRRGRLR